MKTLFIIVLAIFTLTSCGSNKIVSTTKVGENGQCVKTFSKKDSPYIYVKVIN